MADRCDLSPDCTFESHDASDHPCGTKHIPGTPCRYCGKPTPLDSTPCLDCWTPIPGNLADIKALFALGDMSVLPAPVADPSGDPNGDNQ